MEKILIIALTLIAFSQANAQTPAAAEATTIPVVTEVKASTKDTKADEVATSGVQHATPAYVGTNDLNILLLRQGIKKA